MVLARTLAAAVLCCAFAASCGMPAWPAATLCGDDAQCASILCDPYSRAEEANVALGRLRSSTHHSEQIATKLMACADSALAVRDIPGRGEWCEPPPTDPAERPSAADRAMLPYDLATYRLLTSICPSHREVLLATEDLWARDPGGRALLERATHDLRPGSARLGRRGLCILADPDSISAAARDLESSDRPTRIVAMLDLALAGPAARAHAAAIISAADADEKRSVRDVFLPYVLGAIGGEAAVRRLATDAGSPTVDIRRVVRSLASLGHDAAEAAPALRALATTHYLADVRRDAAQAYETVSGEHIEPALVPCPKFVNESGNSWTAGTDSGTLRFASIAWPEGDLGARLREASAGACAAAMKAHRAWVALRAVHSCLLGVNHGEFGGVVLAVDDAGKVQRVTGGNPERFVDEGPQGVLLFEGLAHLRLDRGSVYRLVQKADGAWDATRVAALEVNPVGFTRDVTGRLMLLARNTEQLGDTSLPLACRERPSFIVVRVDEDGRVAAMP